MVGIFDPACELLPPWMRNYTCVLLPFYLLSDLLSPPPLPKLNVQYIKTVCGAVGGGGVELYCRPYSAGVLHSISDQIQSRQNCFTTQNKNDIGGKFATGINDIGGKFFHHFRRHCWYRWQICHRQQIFPPFSLVLLIPVANFPLVSTIPATNFPPVSTTPVVNCRFIYMQILLPKVVQKKSYKFFWLKIFSICVFDTGGKPWAANISENFRKNSKWP